MPELINETMQKIIKNAPYEENRNKINKTTSLQDEHKDGEELKHGGKISKRAVSTEEIKVEFPAEKPWKNKKNKKAAAPKKAKIYDPTKYTQAQMEVLELLDENVELNEE